MKRSRRQKRFHKWYMGVLFVLCLFCMGNTAKAQPQLTLETEIENSGCVLLKWESDSEDGVYQLERAKEARGPFAVLATHSGKTGLITSYDYNVTLGKTYYYKVKKIQGEEIVEESAVQAVKIILAKPVNVKTKRLENAKVKISWSKVGNASGYKVYRSTNPKKKFKKISTVKKNEFTDVNVQKGKVYYYKVCAIKKNKQSATSSLSDVAKSIYEAGKDLPLPEAIIRKKLKLHGRK